MPKCSECGLLAVRDEYNDLVCEATGFTRLKGSHQSSKGIATIAKVFCYANSPSFPTIPNAPQMRNVQAINWVNPIVQAIGEVRQCSQYQSWSPGKTPKEHEEMSFVEKVRSEYRESEMRQSAFAERHHQEMIDIKTSIKTMLETHRRENIESASRIRESDMAASLRDRKEDKDRASTMRKEDRSLSLTGLAVSVSAIFIAAIVGLVQAGKFFWVDMTK